MTTIRDVAARVGLSVGTVSKAIRTPESVSHKNLVRVRAAVAELDYKPNMLSQVFRKKESKTLIALSSNSSSLYVQTVIAHLQMSARYLGYELLVAHVTDQSEAEEHKYLQMVESHLAAGIINISSQASAGQAQHATVPQVSLCDSQEGGLLCSSIGIDNIAAAAMLTRHILELGHRHIAVITGPNTHPHSIARTRGVNNMLEQVDLGQAVVFAEGGFDFDSGYNIAHGLLAQVVRPSALICLNDEMAIGAIRAIHDLGLTVPQDVSVCGFDGLYATKFSIPSLTTVKQPLESIAEKAIELLVNDVKSELSLLPQNIHFEYELSVRDSTAAVRSHRDTYPVH